MAERRRSYDLTDYQLKGELARRFLEEVYNLLGETFVFADLKKGTTSAETKELCQHFNKYFDDN